MSSQVRIRAQVYVDSSTDREIPGDTCGGIQDYFYLSQAEFTGYVRLDLCRLTKTFPER